MSLPDNTIWHLYHSANALTIDGKLLIFDYATPADDRPKGAGLAQGFVADEDLSSQDVYVFASHAHSDHFNEVILGWRPKGGRITHILSFDIASCPDSAYLVEPRKTLELDGLKVVTYPSTDEGVAFSVYAGGRHIYFAGDNAFWNWEGNRSEKAYIRDVLSQIDDGQPIDIGFQICDPRLEGKGEGGIYIFAQALNPGLLVPIHSFGKYAINRKAEKKLKSKGFKNTFWCVKDRGDTFSFAP